MSRIGSRATGEGCIPELKVVCTHKYRFLLFFLALFFLLFCVSLAFPSSSCVFQPSVYLSRFFISSSLPYVCNLFLYNYYFLVVLLPSPFCLIHSFFHSFNSFHLFRAFPISLIYLLHIYSLLSFMLFSFFFSFTFSSTLFLLFYSFLLRCF
jgi:hypothetical protein